MKRNMYAWVAETIAAPVKKPVPVLSVPAVQLLGITVRQLVGDSDLQAKALQAVAACTPGGASVSFMDLSIEAEAFGANIRFSEDEVPTVVGSSVTDEAEAEALQVPEIGAGRTGLNIQAVAKATEVITDRPVFAGAIGPFSLAGRLLGVTDAMYLCYDEPDMVHTVLEKVTQFIIRYCKAYQEAGANGVVIAEPLAGVLSPALAEEFSAGYMKQIVSAVQNEEFIVIYHNCGAGTVQQLDSILANGAKAFHFGNAIRMEDVLPHIPGDVLVMGNVDPAAEFTSGTPESIRAATLGIMEKCCSYPNFVISSGCDIPPVASWDNIHAFYQAASDFYAAKNA